MKRRKLLNWMLALGAAFSCPGWAQTANVVVSAGYSAPAPLVVAPGQIITLLVQGIGANLTGMVSADHLPLPTTLGGISVQMQQTASVPFPQSAAVPLLAVDPTIRTCLGGSSFALCGGRLTAVTVQIPYEMNPNFPRFNEGANDAVLVVSEGGVAGGEFELDPSTDRIHIITDCTYIAPYDVVLPFSGLCGPVVTHGTSGGLVTAANPAKSGEVLVMYAFGLGATVPAVKSGEASPLPPAVLAQSLLIGFDFRKNAAPQRVEEATPDQAALLFAGLTPGFAGLYQINFRVPPVPSGLPPCNVPAGPAQILAVRTNLTVSISGPFSVDGAAICVDPQN